MSANLTRQRRINTITAEYLAIGDIIVDAMGQEWEVKMFSSCKSEDRIVLTFGVERLQHPLNDTLHYSPDDTVRVRNIHTREKEEVAAINHQAAKEVSQRETVEPTEDDGASAIDAVRNHRLLTAYPVYTPEKVSIRIDQSGYVDGDTGKPAFARWEDMSVEDALAFAEEIWEVVGLIEDDKKVKDSTPASDWRTPTTGKEVKSSLWRVIPFNEEEHAAAFEGKVGITSDKVGTVVGWFEDLALAENMASRLNMRPA